MNERVELSIEYRYSMYYTKARGDIQIPVPVLVACFVVRANGARRFVVRVLARRLLLGPHLLRKGKTRMQNGSSVLFCRKKRFRFELLVLLVNL